MAQQPATGAAAAGGRDTLRVALKLTGAFVAFLIGSGFATGQEVMQFFVGEGWRGILGALIFLVVGSYTTVSLLLAGQRHGLRNLEDVFHHYLGRTLGTAYTWYMLVVLYSVYVVMLAGAGSVLQQRYGVAVPVGVALMSVAVLATLYFGLRELVNVIGAIGPVLVFLIIVIALVAVVRDPSQIAPGGELAPATITLRASDNWWLSGMLYTALQVTGLFGFLPSLGASVTHSRSLVIAGLLGPLLFFLALAVVFLAFLASLPGIAGTMIPMLYVAERSVPWIATIYSLVICAGIFTTAVPLLWIVVARFTTDGSRSYRVLAVALGAVAYVGGMTLPFDRLLNLIYPTIGYSGIVLIACMLAKQIRTKSLA
jgi:uncharacterized membrane protein YkvI